MRFVIDARYLRGRPSGIGRQVEVLVERLPAMAPADQFELWTHPEAPRPLSMAPNVRERLVRASPNGPGTVFWPAKLAPLSHADVLHAPHNLLGLAIPCPAVVTVHDLMSIDSPWNEHWRNRLFKHWYTRLGLVHAIRVAALILTPSRATADDIAARFPQARGRLRVASPAADEGFAAAVDEGAAHARAAELTGSDAPFYLCVGQNEPSKGHRHAVEAFAQAAGQHQRLVLVQRAYAGAGLSRLVESLGVAERVLWLPTLPQPDLAALMQSAIALLQPSLAEGFGMPVLEAMACGCPVIVSDIAALKEVTAGAGLTSAAGDSASLAAQMRALAAAPALRAELGARALARAADFSWADFAATVLESYRDAART